MKSTDFSKLIQSIKQAGEIKRGKSKPGCVFRSTDAAPDIKGVRKKLQVSQSEFALMIGVSRSTIQNWEQGRREPDGPAKALLRVAAKNPEAVINALHAA
jgi:putative transcriptional regulator